MLPRGYADAFGWAVGRFWWTGPIIVASIFIILGT
jgi:hypothetical protein